MTVSIIVLKFSMYIYCNLLYNCHLDPKIDFNFIEAEDDERMLKAILYLVKDYLPKVDPNRTIDPIQDIQILSPRHKGSAGIQNLNEALQNFFLYDKTIYIETI